MPSLKLEDQFCFSIYAAGHAFSRAYKPFLDALGLTYPQYIVLIVLWAQDAPTVSQIGEHLLLDSSTLTPLLKRLETQGLVTRGRDDKDERQVRVRLTPEGRALREQAAAIPNCITEAMGRGTAELKKLKAEIDAIRACLIAASEKYPPTRRR